MPLPTFIALLEAGFDRESGLDVRAQARARAAAWDREHGRRLAERLLDRLAARGLVALRFAADGGERVGVMVVIPAGLAVAVTWSRADGWHTASMGWGGEVAAARYLARTLSIPFLPLAA